MSNEKRRRFSPEQKVQIIRETLKNHIPVSEICQKYNISPKCILQMGKGKFSRIWCLTRKGYITPKDVLEGR